MKAKFFKDQWQFRKWLEKNHRHKTELIVGFYKVDSGKRSMTWSESVDQALCFGWIDGIRRSVDDKSYQIRFTPRRETSVWSKINIAKVKKLSKLGLMREAGLSVFRKRKKEKTGVYSHKDKVVVLSPGLKKTFSANKIAWDHFQSQTPSQRKIIVNWIMSAKREITRSRRLRRVIEDNSRKK